MPEETIDDKCNKAVLEIAKHVKDLVKYAKSMDTQVSHFLENYRKDYYDALDGISYQKTLNNPQYK